MKIVSFRNCVDHSMKKIIAFKIDDNVDKNKLYYIFKHNLSENYIKKLNEYYIGTDEVEGKEIKWNDFRDALLIFSEENDYISLRNMIRFLQHVIVKKKITFSNANRRMRMKIF